MTHTKAIGQILLYEQIHKYHNTHRDVIQARRYREIIIHIFHKVTSLLRTSPNYSAHMSAY